MLAPTVIVQPSSRPPSTMGERDVMASADTGEEKHEPNVKEIVAPARLNVPQPDNKSETEDEEDQEVRQSYITYIQLEYILILFKRNNNNNNQNIFYKSEKKNPRNKMIVNVLKTQLINNIYIYKKKNQLFDF